jgi:DNA polymerase III epsilon subunit-like protein
MIFADFETTGLITNEALPLHQQPSIIEIGIVKVSGDGKISNEFGAFVKPPKLPLDPIITKVTGIRDEDLADAKPFVAHLGTLVELFLGEREFVAHNAPFDLSMLIFELRRLGKADRFPFCPRVTDTKVLYAGKLSAWAAEVKGADFVQTHRALDDARLLFECYRALSGEK